jgi:hypothetical protein
MREDGRMRDYALRFSWIMVSLFLIVLVLALNISVFLPEQLMTVILSNLPLLLLALLLVALALFVVATRERIWRAVKHTSTAQMTLKVMAAFIGVGAAVGIQYFKPRGPSYLDPLFFALQLGAFLLPWLLVRPLVSKGQPTTPLALKTKLQILGKMLLAVALIIAILYVFLGLKTGGLTVQVWRVVVPADLFLLFTIVILIVAYRRYRPISRNPR